ncbi:hypothetical protein O181_074697 [Austropuccinia psidii MF-1]|uniref:Chromo domain-containing protein n=1 Tax=Austropuccinia psidii MF-1 TaxID=1389203 RepID=A0A9Q3FBD2_9BASI|nr:hypothetical protein [Austropuccinia psidii MF-1]
MEVSSPCISCVLVGTSEAISYPKSTPIATTPVIVEEKEEWEVSQVLESKLNRGILWYMEEWKGFNEDPKKKGNQLPALPIPQILSRISTLCILTSLAQIPQEFDFMVLGGDLSL